MRIAFLLFFLAARFCALAQAPALKLERVRLFDRDYVRLTDWARAYKVSLHWIVKDRELRATNANSRIFFTMDSRLATINGINFVLSYPVIWQRDKVYVSTADLDATVQPLLFPQKNRTNSFIKTICLDAGHGGKDPGKLDGKNEEKKYALLLAEEVEQLLKQAGFKVVQTRTRDQFVDLPERPRFANQNSADLFVSLHYNAAGTRSAQGVEVYCLTPTGTSSSNGGIGHSIAPSYPGSAQNAENVLLAYHVQKSLVKNLNVEDRGVKRAQFLVLSAVKMPAILIEAGFMTNPFEAKRIYDSTYRKKMALGIVTGILNYKNVVER